MPEGKAKPALLMFTFILTAGVIAQPTHSAPAGDECITKPNSPAPQGQHWYFRIDHQANRQCWRLGPEGLPVQKSAVQTPKQIAQPAARPEAQSRTQRPATTGMASASADTVPVANIETIAPAAPSPWPDTPKISNAPLSLSVPQPQTESPQSNNAVNSAPPEPSSTVASADELPPRVANPVEEPQRPSVMRSASMALAKIIVPEDHKFALLMTILLTLAIAGPVIHFVERRKRRRRREARNLQPPRWAPVVSLNASIPRIHVPLAPNSEPAKSAPPPSPSFQTERVAQALQQLLDRLQTEHWFEHEASHSLRRPGAETATQAQ